MRARRRSPQSLRPLGPQQRLRFWLLMSLGLVLIVVGWIITFKQITSTQGPEIKQNIEEGIDSATKEFSQTTSKVVDQVEDKTTTFSQTLDAIKAGYEAQKALEEQESNSLNDSL